MARKDWAREALVEYDTAGKLAARVAELEGCKRGTKAWALYSVDVYREARDEIAAGYARADAELAALAAVGSR